MNGAGGGSLTRVVPCRAVQLFTDEAKVVSEAMAPFDWGEVQGINVHGVWIMTWVCSLRAMGKVRACVLGSWSLMHQSNFLGDFPLETEVGSLFVPAADGGGDVVHGLDPLHNPDRDSCQEVRDKSGGIFDFIVFGTNNIQLELVDVFLELFSSSDVGGGEPVHGFLLDVGISKGFFKVGFKCDECPEGLVGKTLLVADFSPHGSGPFLHIGQGISNLPVVVMVEGLVDKEIKVNGVQPGLGCLCLSIVFIGASDANLGDP